MTRLLASAVASLALHVTPALAQEMGQGEARITTRSDVRMSLESVAGTSATRLQLLGRAVGAGMTAIRTCYGEAVAERPTVQGTMRLRVALGESGPPNVSVTEDGPQDRQLLACVRGVISRQPMGDASRPASAIVVLVFQNSAAAGAAETARRADEADAVTLAHDGGRASASGEAPGVRFVVRGAAGTSDEHVAEAFRVVRSQIAGMLDCRRRASRREMSPEGQIDLQMSMRQGRNPEMTVSESTVEDERAPICLERALERPHRRPESGPATVDVEVRFLRAAE
jgi:hypothetical protein